MEKKSILIFGAGINQLELINAANDLGCFRNARLSDDEMAGYKQISRARGQVHARRSPDGRFPPPFPYHMAEAARSPDCSSSVAK